MENDMTSIVVYRGADASGEAAVTICATQKQAQRMAASLGKGARWYSFSNNLPQSDMIGICCEHHATCS